MKKQELSDLLHSLQIPVNEGIASQENTNKYPRVVYWDYIWEDILASGEEYENVETYHEYVQEDKVFHSYFSVEVTV